MIRPTAPVMLGISLTETWIPALELAADKIRNQHPKIEDAELMERIFVHGLVAIIGEHDANDAPYGQIGQQVVAVLR